MVCINPFQRHLLLISELLGLPKRVMTILQQCRELASSAIRYDHSFFRARNRLLSMLQTKILEKINNTVKGKYQRKQPTHLSACKKQD